MSVKLPRDGMLVPFVITFTYLKNGKEKILWQIKDLKIVKGWYDNCGGHIP